MKTINVFALTGSLRKNSTNMGLLEYARDHAPDGMNIEIGDLHDIPFFNQDITETPDSVKKLFEGFKKADAFIFGVTEYNYSLTPALKNALDWASRSGDSSLLDGKSAALMGAGGGMGTSRAQYHLRQVCVYLNIHPLNKPEVFSNAFSESFNSEGKLVDDTIKKLIDEQLLALQKAV
jgi:chromate reductase